MKKFPYERAEWPPAPYLDLKIRPSLVEVALSPRTNVLLGRDVLNQLRVTLDGPRQITEIHNV